MYMHFTLVLLGLGSTEGAWKEKQQDAGDEATVGCLKCMYTAVHSQCTCTWKFTDYTFHFLFHHDEVFKKNGPDDQRET